MDAQGVGIRTLSTTGNQNVAVNGALTGANAIVLNSTTGNIVLDVNDDVTSVGDASCLEPMVRAWSAADDEYLKNIVDSVVGAVGKNNVERFILAGHSQGGMTSNRIICTDYFKDKVDVRISLSGGRIGPAARPEGGGFAGLRAPPVWQQVPGPPASPPAAPGRPARPESASSPPRWPRACPWSTDR